MNEPTKAIQYLIDTAPLYAKAKADRMYLEEFRKSKKALLMKQSLETALGAQERDAYAHPEYIELLRGIEIAVQVEEKLRWDLIAAQARVDIWRTEQANLRNEGKATI